MASDLRWGQIVEVRSSARKVVVDQVASNLEEQHNISHFPTKAKLMAIEVGIMDISIVGLASRHRKDNTILGQKIVCYNQQYYKQQMIVDFCKAYLVEMAQALLASCTTLTYGH